jgi:hypothetical protein
MRGKRLVAVVSPVLLAATATIFSAAPAQAASQCSFGDDKEFQTVGVNTHVMLRVCVSRENLGGNPDEYRYRAAVHGRFVEGGAGDLRKFDDFELFVRLERHDTAATGASCELASKFNGADYGEFHCRSPYYTTRSTGGWTGDGVVDYNLNGGGDKSWALDGSPAL